MKTIKAMLRGLLYMLPGSLAAYKLHEEYRRREKMRLNSLKRGNFTIKKLHTRADPNKDTVEIVYLTNEEIMIADPAGVYGA